MARTNALSENRATHGLKPKYLRYNIWSEDSSILPASAEWSEIAPPLLSPPAAELCNPVVNKTIADNPSLFDIITPINVNKFEQLLSTHPNQSFVASVCQGLRMGFWPAADTHIGIYPDTHDEHMGTPSNERCADFLRQQRDDEVAKHRFSHAFGPDLLPGMYCMPIHAVPKPGSIDLRLVTDQSAGPYSLNSMVQREFVPKYPLDNMHHLGQALLHLRELLSPDQDITIFKSDIAEAYRLMPMHPCWQVKQVNTIDGLRYIDRNNAFGGSASGAIFVAFNSLVTWIAKNVFHIPYLAIYCDDSFAPQSSDDLVFYPPFNTSIPRNQKILLDLWDSLGIPFKQKKQVFGSPLTVIGINVDANRMTLSLPSESREKLLDEISHWVSRPSVTTPGSHKLRKWQALAGWINWSFNVYPLLRPCLNNFYPKIAGKTKQNQRIWVNNAIRDDLSWAADHMRSSSGVHLIRSQEWDPNYADAIIYCDACMEGMAFWYPELDTGFYAPVPLQIPADFIYYYEALCVACALYDVSNSLSSDSRVLIFTDNSNTVDMFNSLRCPPAYNFIVRFAADTLIKSGINLRVVHVPGDQNDVADALSRQDFARALNLVPNLNIQSFQPPQSPLGASKK